MKLLKVRIQNFKSIVDSGVVEIEDRVTVLVGKNEQGKTTFLRGLASWSPKVIYGPGDLPNHLRLDLEKQNASKIPIVTLWLVPENQDLETLKRILPSDAPLASQYKTTRFYDGHQRWSRFAGQAGGLAKVDSGLDYAANFSSFACVA